MFEHDSVMDEPAPAVFLDHPEYDRLALDFEPRFAESPWSPEVLEPRIIGEQDKPAMPMKHMLALVTPTQMMEVISGGESA